MTYSQMRTVLGDLYHFDLADSEIARILQAAGRACQPEYESLKTRIRSGPAHLDESPYHIQEDDNSGYAWAMAGADGTPAEHDVVFKLADSRGKGNAEELLGPDYQGVRITDGYGGYKYLPGLHQECWAHLYRIIRDLAQVSTLPENKRAHVGIWLVQFKQLYSTLRHYLDEPFDEVKGVARAKELTRQVRRLCRPDSKDPKKLANLKAFMLDYEHALFTCLVVPGVPADNNKAERVIRKLVLKRKKSFGCKTNQGAKALEVMMSVCWSTWYREQGNFFPAMQALATS
jgi:transposase